MRTSDRWNGRLWSVVGSGNSTFLQNSEFRKHKKPKIQFFTFLNHQKTQNNSSFFWFSSCAINLEKSSTFFQKCKGIFKFVLFKDKLERTFYLFKINCRVLVRSCVSFKNLICITYKENLKSYISFLFYLNSL